MRLISQDGTKDYPYEISGICAFRYGDAYKILVHGNEVLANYSTKEKALKVMSMLQQAYIGRNEAINLDMTKEDEEQLTKIVQEQGFGTLVVHNDRNNPSVEFTPLHTYFKFPADEEVEV